MLFFCSWQAISPRVISSAREPSGTEQLLQHTSPLASGDVPLATISIFCSLAVYFYNQLVLKGNHGAF